MKQNIISESDGRLRCLKFKQCGGCSYELEYAQQLERKQQKANKLLSRFGKVEDIVPMDNPYYYRTKISRVYKKANNGKLIPGVYKSNDRGMVPIRECILEDKRLCEIAGGLADIFTSLKIAPFDPRTGRGDIRHILLRRGAGTGEILLCIVTPRAELKSKNTLVKLIKTKFTDITTIVHNIDSGSMPLSLGKREDILLGSGYITGKIMDRRFKISAGSFMQVNSVQTEKLYSCVKELLHENCDTLIDAYCGTGTIGLICSDKTKNLYGVEKTPSAVKDAKANALLNGVQNAEFICGDAREFMERFVSEGMSADAVIMDPPRAGADRRFLEALSKLSPRQIIYISCSPETLARNLAVLKKSGYKAECIRPFDMFPHTVHIECVVSLIK